MRFTAILFLVIIGIVNAQATDADKQLKEFIHVARDATMQLSSVEPTTGYQNPKARISVVLNALEQTPAPLVLESVQGAVTEVSNLLYASTKVREKGASLVATLIAERNRNIAAYRAEVEALLVKSIKACVSATTPADLDETLKALTVFQRQQKDTSGRAASLEGASYERAVQMSRFVARWQDYLADRLTPNNSKTRNDLAELGNLVDPSLLPRSQLFDLPEHYPPLPIAPAAPPKPSPEEQAKKDWAAMLVRIGEVETVDELDGLVKDIEPIAAALPFSTSIQQLRDMLKGYIADKKALASRQINPGIFFRPFPIQTAPAGNPDCSQAVIAAFQRLRIQLQHLSLQVVFKDSGLTLRSDEPIDAYIMRVAQAAAAADNWEYVFRTLEFYRSIYPDSEAPAWTARELLSCWHYVAARKLDEAEQLSRAILAYQDALRTTGRLTPVKIIKNRLAEIKNQHPEAFDEALRISDQVKNQSLYPQVPYARTQRTSGTYLFPESDRPFAPAP
jgi:hypothetical protein